MDAFKDLVNKLSVPEISLTFFFVPLFVMMLVFYKWWTRPIFAAGLALIFVVSAPGAGLM